MKPYNNKKTFLIIFSLVALGHAAVLNMNFFNMAEQGTIRSAVIHHVYLKHYGSARSGQGRGGDSDKADEVVRKKTASPPPPAELTPQKKAPERPVGPSDKYSLKKPLDESLPDESAIAEVTGTEAGSGEITGGDGKEPGEGGISIARIREAYLNALRLEIEKHREYPFKARWRSETGTVCVCIVIEEDGSITDIRIERSSGYATLDNAAVETLSKIKKFKPIPAELGMERWKILINIEYSLDLA